MNRLAVYRKLDGFVRQMAFKWQIRVFGRKIIFFVKATSIVFLIIPALALSMTS
jgi:hypothetical protein